MEGDVGKYAPYPAYKASGVAWSKTIPENWCVKRLSTLVEFQQGKAHEPFIDEDGSYICVNSRFVSTEGQKVKYCTRNLTPTKIGDVLMVMSDLPNGRALAKAYFVKDSGPYAVNQRVCRLRATEADPRFLFYLLNRNNYFLRFDDGVNQTHLSNAAFTKFPAVVPSLSEQTQIAAFLDHETARIDELIAKQLRLIALLEEKRQAVISHAVTQGLNPNTPLRPSGIDWLGDVPAHWEVGYLGYEASIKARLGWKGLKADEYVDDGYIFLATPNIKSDQIDFENVNFITQERYDESPEIALKVGDVLVTKDGSTTGTTNVVRDLPRPATVNSSIAVIRSSGRLASIYLYFWFQSEYTQNVIKRMQDGMGVPHLFQADLRKFCVLLPPATEQYEIVRHLEDVVPALDKLLRKAQSAITLLQERRSALISAAVTGAVDVRDWRPPADRKTSQGEAA
ncbi:restriction endonuclease subunit S [Roseibium sp. RKSG952]|uniref:restriction endonuclease subunit S n=1 Tax=Roseibium sp. RKSG952 TaxID=2529384 RepID=UPI0012BC3E98|nr:restriction endonuclease subunit S [Roseibium sp. RKSG952]MTI03694.1 restriction endonuclease subunit S [Roseibium sp. RKSG952]